MNGKEPKLPAVRSIAWLDVGVISVCAIASGRCKAKADDKNTAGKTPDATYAWAGDIHVAYR
jgi:hypothetical protein